MKTIKQIFAPMKLNTIRIIINDQNDICAIETERDTEYVMCKAMAVAIASYRHHKTLGTIRERTREEFKKGTPKLTPINGLEKTVIENLKRGLKIIENEFGEPDESCEHLEPYKFQIEVKEILEKIKK